MSQTDKLLDLLLDGIPLAELDCHRFNGREFPWRDTPTIQVEVYGRNHLGVARIAARIADAKAKLPKGWTIESEPTKVHEIWQYRICTVERPATPQDMFALRPPFLDLLGATGE